MTKKRSVNDGLPHRVYERKGVRVYSIGYKSADGSWDFRLRCSIDDRTEIAKLRKEATRRALARSDDGSELETISSLITDWFAWQCSLPVEKPRANAPQARSARTSERQRTCAACSAPWPSSTSEPTTGTHIWTNATSWDRGPKGNKEVSLFQSDPSARRPKRESSTSTQWLLSKNSPQRPALAMSRTPNSVDIASWPTARRFFSPRGAVLENRVPVLATIDRSSRSALRRHQRRRHPLDREEAPSGRLQPGSPDRWSPELRAVIHETLHFAVPQVSLCSERRQESLYERRLEGDPETAYGRLCRTGRG